MEALPRPLKEIVTEALDLPEVQRVAFLEQACAGDGELHHEAASLLKLDSASVGFLEDSPMARSETCAPLLEGSRLDAYRILRPLGAGGMGEVYLAERADGAFEQRVAIKVIRASGGLGELLERFVSERQLLADLKHPNIANLLDGGTTGDGRPYLVMEYVDGEPIDDFCNRRGLPVEARLRLFLEVCVAVEHAHRHLVVHRDLKPANILVTTTGEPKLLDFGVAKDLGGAGKTPDTRLLVPVTPEYASPEQLTGGAVTTASDVYALGVVLYELLAGQSPFDGEDPLAGRSRSAPPDRPSTRVRRAGGPRARPLRRRLTGDLDHIVLRALAPDLADRYPSVEQLARDLERHLEGLPLETREGTLYRIGTVARRNWRWLTAAAVVAGIGGFWLDETLERRQLQSETRRVTQLSEDLGEYLVELFLSADPGRTGERSEALEQMLEHGAELLRSETLAGEPLMRAELLSTIGQVYRKLALPAKGELLLRESLALRRQHLPPGDEWIAVGCNNLANSLRDLGDYTEARSLLWEARTIFSRILPADHLRIAKLLNNLAGVEKDLGRFDEAIQHYEDALAIKRRLVLNPSTIAMAIKNLGTALRAAGRLEEAEVTLQQARAELSLSELPQPATEAGLDYYLGAIRRQRGDLPAARQLLERAHTTRVGLYGEDHKKPAETLLELALVDQLEGRCPLAEKKLRTVVEVRRRRLGTEHPQTAETLVLLARLLAQRGEVDAATALVGEAVEIFRHRLPAGHRWTVEAEDFLARMGPQENLRSSEA